jgi:anti-sigma B factor antagonist
MVRVSVNGKMDAVTAPDFESAFTDIVAQGDLKFLVDLSSLEYISSAGLRAILVVAKRLKERDGEMLFVGLQGNVRDVFKISGFYSLFRIFGTEDEITKQN